MKTNFILVVDSNLRTLRLIQNTFDEANVLYETCSRSEDGWNLVLKNPQLTSVLIRMNAADIDGCDLCRRIREVRSEDQLSILMIVGEDQLEHATSALEAGATDVLIDPFEARELRMRMNILLCSDRRRVDEAHTTSVPETKESPVPITYKEIAEQSQQIPNLVMPKFDPQSQRFTYGASEDQIAAWKNDERVTKVALDQVLTRPCCAGLPTFRQGCGNCGSAWTRPEALIHHYACAHIGPESEFRNGNDLLCPKCRQTGLVVGSDFETVTGGYRCADCGARTSQAELIGHCLSCEHRFPATEAVSLELTGFHVHRVQEVDKAGGADREVRENRTPQRRSVREKSRTTQ